MKKFKYQNRKWDQTYRRVVGLLWVWVGRFVLLLVVLEEVTSHTPTRSTQVDPSEVEDSHSSPPPVCQAGTCSADLRGEAALRCLKVLQTHTTICLIFHRPFRKSTKSSASQEQSQGFPSSLSTVDLRGLKTRGDTRVILFSDKSSTAKAV